MRARTSRLSLFLVVAVPVLGGAGGLSVRSEEPTLRAGAAITVITPPAGTPMAGYYYERAAEGVHDDLFAKALVLESGGHKAALVALDLITTPRDLVEEARAAIEKETGIPGASVMVSATHAHTGPVLSGRSTRDEALGGRSDAAQAYRSSLPVKIAEAVKQANAKATDARLSIAHGHEATIGFNRRFHMTDGTVGWNPGKLNPKILKPAGTIDPDVPVIYVESAAKTREPIAAYVNYAVHLDNVGGLKISADMPATLSKLLGEFKGPDLVTLFTAGCCGDINHINVRWPEPQSGFTNATRMGIVLAGEVLRVWPKLEAIPAGGLRTRSEIVRLPLPEVSEDDVKKAEAVVARHRQGSEAGSMPPTFLETVQAYKVLDVAARKGKSQEVEVQVIALGDQVAWVSLPGEIFVELGLAIKQDSPFPHTIVAELANGSIGYIPSRRAYPQGNYEVVSARCAEGSGELLVEAAVRLLKQIRIEATSSAPTASSAAK